MERPVSPGSPAPRTTYRGPGGMEFHEEVPRPERRARVYGGWQTKPGGPAPAPPGARPAPRATCTPGRRAAPHMLVGINDEADALYGNPATSFATLKSLRVQVLRVNLYWGGNKWAVANKKPTDPTDPGDPAYNWALYDRLVKYANTYNIKV